MSRRLSAFFKFVVAFAAVNAVAELPIRELHLSDRGGGPLRVGDTVSYEIRGGDEVQEAQWQIDPGQGGLKKGILFRPGRLITPLVAGRFQAPSLTVIDSTGNPVARTGPIELQVESNLSSNEQASGEPPKPEPAIGPIGLPVPAWVQSAIGTGILLGFLLLLFWIIRLIRRRAARAIRSMLPKKPYDLASLDKLDELLKKGWIEKKKFKPFYFGISETLKFYLGERFDFDARESTSSELFSMLRARVGNPDITDALVDRIEKLFDRLDPVKFADVIPEDGEARSVHREAKDIVLSTRKTEPPAVGKAKGAPR